MKSTVNKIQKLQFALMKEASFNGFLGEQVVDDLLSHKDLWKGVVMDRLDDLIKLRDISDGYWNVDTLFILPSGKDNAKLATLAANWNADEIDWIEGDEAQRLLGVGGSTYKGLRILRVWWD